MAETLRHRFLRGISSAFGSGPLHATRFGKLDRSRTLSLEGTVVNDAELEHPVEYAKVVAFHVDIFRVRLETRQHVLFDNETDWVPPRWIDSVVRGPDLTIEMDDGAQLLVHAEHYNVLELTLSDKNLRAVKSLPSTLAAAVERTQGQGIVAVRVGVIRPRQRVRFRALVHPPAGGRGAMYRGTTGADHLLAPPQGAEVIRLDPV